MKKVKQNYDLHAIKERHNLTGARIGVLTGTSPRAARHWLTQEDNPTYRKIPLSAWWLLRILLGEATPAEIIKEAEERINAEDETI
jgi:hypothetical protein